MAMSRNNKAKASDTDTSDEDDDAQMRQFLEAADHTLLTNAMFQKPAESQATALLAPSTNGTSDGAPTNPAQKPPKSERYLDEQSGNAAAGSDLQISEHMQTHIWRKLSTIIHNQIDFCAPEKSVDEQETAYTSQVKLVSNADCYIGDDIIPETLPQKKPTIKRRLIEEEQQSPATVAVSGDFILSGQDMQYWAQREPRKHKFFKYRASDPQGHKLQAIVPTNEFTERRRKNKWNETKICQRFQNKIDK